MPYEAEAVFSEEPGTGGGSGESGAEGVGAFGSVLPPPPSLFGDDLFEQYIDPPREGSVYCGDGAYDPELEECDDGIGNELDTCSEACQTRDLLAIPAAPGGRVLSRRLGLGRHPISGGYLGGALVWVDASGPPQIVVQLRDVYGQRAEEVVVADATLREPGESQPTLASSPVVATLPSGSHVIAYGELNGDGSELGVALRPVSHVTGTLGEVRFVNETVTGAQQEPDLLFTEAGLVVAWVDTSDPLNGPDVRYRIYDEELNPEGGESTLAASPLPEGAVTLSSAAGNTGWAAAWRRGEADGTEAIVVSYAGEQIAFTPEWNETSGAAAGVPESVGGAGSAWNEDKLMPGHIEDRLGLAPLGDDVFAVAFTVGTDPEETGVANVFRLWTAVVDFSSEEVVWIGPIEPLLAGAPDEKHSQRSPTLADASPPHVPGATGQVFLGWRAEAALGDAGGEELWLKRLAWDEAASELVLTEDEVALTRDEGSRPGDQRQPAFANIPVPGGHALAMAWEDWGVNFDSEAGSPLDEVEQARPDVVVQVAPVPLRRDPNRLLDCSYAACGIGQGPCEIDDDCAGGLICGKGRGPWYGYSPEIAVCSPPSCTNGVRDAGETAADCGGECGPCFECEEPSSSLGTAHFCSAVCRCENTEGDCDSDFDCVRSGTPALDLTCEESSGTRMGWPEPLDLCLRAQCSNGVKDADETLVDCGGPSCPACTGSIAIDCTSTTTCGEGVGHCANNSECGSGLSCAAGQGELYGYASEVSVCVPTGCETGRGAAYTGTACSEDCPCGAGVGDCASDDECLGAANKCRAQAGVRFGQAPSLSICVPDQCYNDIKDANEIRVDCGGPCGTECPVCPGDATFRSFEDAANSSQPAGSRGFEFVSGSGITWTKSTTAAHGASSLQFGGTGTAVVRGPAFAGSVFDVIGSEFQLDLALLDGGGALPASIAQTSDLKVGIYHPTLGTTILIDTAFAQSPSGNFVRQTAPVPVALLEAIALDEDGFQVEVQISMPAATTGPILRLDYMQLGGDGAFFRSICKEDSPFGNPSADLFGFEDPELWTSPEVTLASEPMNIRQGTAAGSAQAIHHSLTSDAFELGSDAMSHLLLDVYLPTGTAGASVELTLACPTLSASASDSHSIASNQTGKWLTLPFDLSAAFPELDAGASGCTITIETSPNTSSLTSSVLYDYLRFAPDTYCASAVQIDANPFAVGSSANGTAASPYKLCTAAQIQMVMNTSSLWNKNFELEADIDLAGVTGQIGTSTMRFRGTFDGRNHYLSNYAFSGGSYAGFFGYVQGDGVVDGLTDGEIKNLTASNFHVGGVESVGVMVGRAYSARLFDIYVVSGSVQGAGDNIGGLVGYAGTSTLIEGAVSGADVGPTIGDSSGGLVGRLYGSTILRSRSFGSVTVGPTLDSTDVGGLVGMVTNSSTVEDSSAIGPVLGKGSSTGGFVGDLRDGSVVRRCVAEGTVSSLDDDVGGFAGFAWGATLDEVKATGDVNGADNVGGLVGRLYGGSVAGGAADGAVTGLNYSGGLVGESSNAATITRSSASGPVSGAIQVGGLVGRCLDTAIQDSFAVGNVLAGSSRAGGTVGSVANCTLERTHAFGSVATDGSMVGTVAAVNYDDPLPEVPSSFFASFGNVTANPGIVPVNGFPSEPGATNLTAAQFKDASNFTNWDFFSVWEMGENYPELRKSSCQLYQQQATPPFAVGMAQVPDGTALKPYPLCTAAQVQHVMNTPSLWDSNFRLESDIDLTGVTGRIGTSTTTYRGTFDGAGRKLSNYSFSSAMADYAGLFGEIVGDAVNDGYLDGHVHHLVLENFNVLGRDYVGALAGRNSGRTEGIVVRNAAVTGSRWAGGAIGENWAVAESIQVQSSEVTCTVAGCGGVVGKLEFGTIDDSRFESGEVIGVASVGGLVGEARGSIRTSSSAGWVHGTADNVGGLVGYATSGGLEVADSSSSAVVVGGTSSAGGLIGFAWGSVLTRCTAAGPVSGSTNVGGLVGYVLTDAVISESSASGEVHGTDLNVGGLVGALSGATCLITDSSATGSVNNLGSNSGGLVGKVNAGKVKNSTASGVVVANGATAGGFAGNVEDGATIENSSALGDVTGDEDGVGGFLGSVRFAALMDCTARGDVAGQANNIGGFAGNAHEGSVFVRSNAYGSVRGAQHSGGFVGYARANASFSRCGAYGDLQQTSGDIAGGFAGMMFKYLDMGGSVESCSASGAVQGAGDYVGGLIGEIQAGLIVDSWAEGRVEGNVAVGGLAGRSSQSSNLLRSYAKGDVRARMHTGAGLVGSIADATIVDSYSSGNVVSAGSAGGLVANAIATTVMRSYAYGSVSAATGEGGTLLGYDSGGNELASVFSRPEASSPNIPPTSNSPTLDAFVTGLTSEQFKDPSHFTSAGWDFETVWQMGPLGPTLRDSYCSKNEQLAAPPYVVVAEGQAAPTGGASDPYVLCNASQVAGLMASADAALLGKHFRVAQSISLAGLDGQIGDAGTSAPFTGTFDGGGHELLNYVPDGQTDDAGLFDAVVGDGTIDGVADGHVKNLVLRGATVAGGNRVGVVVGTLTNGQLDNVQVVDAVVSGSSNVGGLAGVVESGSRIFDSTSSGQVSVPTLSVGGTAGGLVGFLSGGTLWDSHSTAAVSVSGPYAGGLLGRAADSALSICSATGNVQAVDYGGGLIGLATNTSVTRCWAKGTATASGSYAGGLLGASVDGLVNDAYATGAVSGPGTNGGLIGDASGTSISRTYATGAVSGAGTRGGLIGTIDGDVYLSGSFGSSATNGSLSIVGNGSGAGATYLTPTEFTDWSNFQAEGWEFGGIWKSGPTGPELSAGADLDSQPCLAYAHAEGAPFILGMPTTPDGTEDNPWPICSRDHFEDIIATSSLWDDHFVLLADVSLAGTSGQLGTDADPFEGSFDGNGHTLSNYSLNSAGNHTGLFGAIEADGAGTGNVRNLTLEAFVVSGTTFVGALAGRLGVGATIESVRVVGGAVTGNFAVGGLVGRNNGGTILDCDASASVTGASQGIGGLVGESSAVGLPLPAGLISGSSASGTVTGSTSNAQFIGGLVGWLIDGIVLDSSAAGDADGFTHIGGLIGALANDGTTAKVYDSAASGAVSGDQGVGGLVGGVVNGGFGTERAIVERSFATGPVTADTYVGGGLVGFSVKLTLKDCFATGDVDAAYGGGLVGYGPSGQVINSYASGVVTGGTSIGALAGAGGLEFFNGFGTTDSNPTLQAFGDSADALGAKMATIAELGDPAFLGAAGWDTARVWQTGSGPATFASRDGELPFCERYTPTNSAPFVAEAEGAPAGTVQDPYKICTQQQLGVIADNEELLSGHYELAAHIDLSSFDDQIGTETEPFSGTLEGNGYLLHEFEHTGAGTETGLFGVVSGDGESSGVIRGVNLSQFDVDGAGNVGSLVGKLSGGLLETVQVRGSSVSGTADKVGGLVGDTTGTIRDAGVEVSVSLTTGKRAGGVAGFNRGLIENVISTGDVVLTSIEGGTVRPIGGLVGEMTSGAIRDCVASGSVSTVGDRAGGMVGDLGGGELVDSVATGDVTADGTIVGGLVGLLDSVVRSSRATGDVRSGSQRAGGLVGQAQNGALIEDSHAYGDVHCPYETGGLVGYIATSGANISRSSAHGHVFGDREVGGLIGDGNNDTAGQGIINRCYAEGVAFATDYRAGGLFGRADTLTVTESYARNAVNDAPGAETGAIAGVNVSDTSTFAGVYYDGDTSNVAAVGSGSGTGITSRGFSNIRTQSTYTGWDFTNVWEMAFDGPRLRSEGLPLEFCDEHGQSQSAPFTTGTGTAGSQVNPYRICTGAQLAAAMGSTSYWNKHLSLEADVNMSGQTGQLGSTTTAFTGVFDGRRHQIVNYTNNGTATDVGLFGHVSGNGSSTGIVANIVMGDSNVSGATNVGAFVGRSVTGILLNLIYSDSVVSGTASAVGGIVGWNSGLVQDVWADGSVTGASTTNVGGVAGYSSGALAYSTSTVAVTRSGTGGDNIGGLVGRAVGGTVSDSSAYGNVSSSEADTGGLVGEADSSAQIQRCSASGSVTITTSVTGAGGLVGRLVGNSAVSESSALGVVSGYRRVGGLVGALGGASITDSFATGNATSSSYEVGGLVGYISTASGTAITRSYSTGDATGTSRAGGLVGHMLAGSITDSYSIGDASSSDATGATGGLVGIANAVTVTDCYSFGASDLSSGNINSGSFIGTRTSTTVTTSYAHSSVNSGLLRVGASGSVTGITGRTTAQFAVQSNFSGFSFTSTWVMDATAGRPVHQ